MVNFTSKYGNFTIDRKNKTFVLDNGEVFPIPEEDVREVLRTPHAKALHKKEYEQYKKYTKESKNPALETGIGELEESFLGNPGATINAYFRAGKEAFTPGKGQENLNFYDRTVENFYGIQGGRKKAKREAYEEHPTAGMIGKGLGVGSEFAVTSGLSGAKAFPLITGMNSETSILEPWEKAKELAIAGSTGYLADKVTGILGKVAQTRKGIQKVKGAQKEAEKANVLATEEAAKQNQANLLKYDTEKAAYEADVLNAERATQADKIRHANEVEAKQAEMIRTNKVNEADKARFQQQTAANELEAQTAKDLVKEEEGRYAQDLARTEEDATRIAERQKFENEHFLKQSGEEAEKISKVMGKETMGAETLGVEEYIENTIARSPNAATSEANFVSKFLRSLFKGDKSGRLSGANLKKALQSLQEVIIKSEGATKQMLLDFRKNLIQGLPQKLSQGTVIEKWTTKLLSRLGDIGADITKSIQAIPSFAKNLGKNFSEKFSGEINSAVKRYMSGLEGTLAENISKPEFQANLTNYIKNLPSYRKMVTALEKYQAITPKGNFPFTSSATEAQRSRILELVGKSENGILDLENFVLQYPQSVAQKIVKGTEELLPEIEFEIAKRAEKAQKSLRYLDREPNVLELPGEVAPIQTIEPNLQPVQHHVPIEPNLQPIRPHVPTKTNLAPVNKPAPIEPNLQAIPEMPEQTTLLGKFASAIEKLNFGKAKEAGANLANTSGATLLAKIAGIPIGKVAGAVGAGITGIKGLTSPTQAGDILRKGIDVANRAIYEVNQKAEKYPSYQNGIIENPQERRSLSKEIEEDPEISLEQKALLQSKVNRGLPLQNRLS